MSKDNSKSKNSNILNEEKNNNNNLKTVQRNNYKWKK